MTQSRYTLSCPARSLDAAQQLADRIDAHIAIDALAVTVNETDEALALWDTIAYFEDEAAASHAASTLNIAGAVIAKVPEVDWVRRSLQGLAPVIAGRFFLHGSHDRPKRRGGGHSFEIDAGTAFGTGHHGTTTGCLRALDNWLKHTKPRHVFDLGCGTGVLALAAARATRRLVLATDIDPEAIRVTKLNAALNDLGPQVHALTAAGLHHPAIRKAGPFDLVFANILARPLALLAQNLSALLSPGGIIILSGLTHDQLRWIRACYRQRGLIPVQTIRIENWIALVVRKPMLGTKTKRPRQQGQGRFGIGTKAPGWENA